MRNPYDEGAPIYLVNAKRYLYADRPLRSDGSTLDHERFGKTISERQSTMGIYFDGGLPLAIPSPRVLLDRDRHSFFAP